MASDDGLEIKQDLTFQRREWRIQRVVWLLLAALLVAALAGLLGPGPLSSTSRQAAGFDVHYLRFTRWQAPHTLTITVLPSAGPTVALAINRSYLDSMQVQQITPQPASVKLSGNNYIFDFDNRRAQLPTDIAFDLQPSSMGTVHAIIGLLTPGSPTASVHLTQLVYP
jgi:hypothetical protein